MTTPIEPTSSTPQAGPSSPSPSSSSSTTNPLFGKKKTPKVPKPQPAKIEPKPKPKPVPVGPFDKPDEEEEKNVHEVYEAIAGHFSQTRHKPWPFIQKFLHSLPSNSIGLDSGAGNGKYLPSSREAGLEMIALDRSSGLLEIAKNENGGECVRGDLGFRGWREGVFDFAISIAAIHHLSTPERRRHAVKSLIRPLKLSSTPSYSKFMIYVWAYEQGTLSKRSMGTLTNTKATSTNIPNTSHPASTPPADEPTSTTKEEDKPDEGVKEIENKIQDLLVPWVYSKPPSAPGPSPQPSTKEDNGQSEKPEPKVYHRYYHLFIEGELKEMVVQAAEEDGFEVLVDGTSSEELEESIKKRKGEGKEGEEGKKWLRVRGVGWEADNWWIECEVGKL